jgi:hypothetical protein
LHELFIETFGLFFTMELVCGQPFDRYIRVGESFEAERLRATLLQLLSAVRAIHAAGKLHRDLKPSNVLVTPDGRVVVLDFGLVSDSDVGGVGQTLSEERRCGTPAYMAPEQASGQPATAASDHYAVGVMLFEALTGRLPFEGFEGEILARKQHFDAPRASSLAQVPEAHDALCALLLTREPAARLELPELDCISGANLDAAARAQRKAPTAPAPDATPKFLGRSRELQQLRDAFAATLAGRPTLLFVAGDSGIGKTALVSAFVAELQPPRVVVLSGRCQEREHVPYQGFDAVLDDLSRYLRKLPEADAAALLPREVYALARLFPVLQRVDVIAQAPIRLVPDPQDLKVRAFAAFGELLGRIRDRVPLVIVIDDVQWFDQDSLRFLRAWLLLPEPAPLLLVCVHRSDSVAPETDARRNDPRGALNVLPEVLRSIRATTRDKPALEVETLEVGPLDQSALVALLAPQLSTGAGAAEAAALAAASMGSPFLAGELVRALPLREAGAPPPSLADALSIHFADLPLECRRILSVMALAGQPLVPALVFDAAEISEGYTHLDRLRNERLVRVSFDVEGERVVECYHDQIREHVDSSCDELHRRELFLALSRALLARPDAPAELLSHALEAAGLPEQAAEHTVRAAERAMDALAFDRAAELFARALEHGDFDDMRRHALRVARARALAYAGYGELAGLAFLEAVCGADEGQTQELMRHAAEQFLSCGQLERGRSALARSFALTGMVFPQSSSGALVSLAWSRLRLRMRGYAFEARQQSDPITARRLELLRVATQSFLRSDHLRGMDYCARWTRAALDAGDLIEIGRALAWELMMSAATGASRNHVAELRRICTRTCRQTGDAVSSFTFAFALGTGKIQSGDAQSALQQFDRACELLNANPSSTTSYDRAWAQSYRAMSLILCGRATDAGELAQVQLEDALTRGDHIVSGNLTQVACYAAIAADRPDHAAELLAQAARWLLEAEPNFMDYLWLCVQPLPLLYRGLPAEAWQAAASHRERFTASFVGRITLRGFLENECCGLAVAAAAQTDDSTERQRLERTACRYAAIALKRSQPIGAGIPAAALACMRGDRNAAVLALRTRVESGMAPMSRMLARRRLGELLGGTEGAGAIRAADEFLRAGGVVDPERFTAALTPGVEIH